MKNAPIIYGICVFACLAIFLCLTGCASTTARWEGADGSSGMVKLDGEYGVLTQEVYNGSAGILGFGSGADGSLSRGRTFAQTQAQGQPFELHIGPDGMTVRAATASHSPATRALGNVVQDTAANAAAASIVKTGIGALQDVTKVGIRAATR